MFSKTKEINELIERRKIYRILRKDFYRYEKGDYFGKKTIYDIFMKELKEIQEKKYPSDIDLIKKDLIEFYITGLKQELDDILRKTEEVFEKIKKTDISKSEWISSPEE